MMAKKPKVDTKALQSSLDYLKNRADELTQLETQAGATAVAGGVKPPKLPGESNTQYNARITEYYKAQPKPELNDLQRAAGGIVQFVRTGAAGEGEYRVIYPPGTKLDANGNPIIVSTGSKTPTGGGGGGGGGYSGGGGGMSTEDATAKLLADQAKAATEAANLAARQSAYDLLYAEFNKYGLGSLVEDIKGLIQDAKTSPSQFAIALQNTDAYKKRFAANQDRIKAGLRALTPAEYIGLEDQYQNIMRNYGLPASYWSKDSMGTQAGFNKFIANDVSAAELEDRIATAQKRVIDSDVNTKDALRRFYPDITDGDILAYTLDPTNALENIKRKVTAAEIGGAAIAQGLATGVSRAEELAKYGITKAQAQQGYGAIGEFLPTAEKLGDIYTKQGMGPYDQLTAEQEVFGTQGSAQAALKRKKLSELERATFAGTSGAAQGALARDRAGAY